MWARSPAVLCAVLGSGNISVAVGSCRWQPSFPEVAATLLCSDLWGLYIDVRAPVWSADCWQCMCRVEDYWQGYKIFCYAFYSHSVAHESEFKNLKLGGPLSCTPCSMLVCLCELRWWLMCGVDPFVSDVYPCSCACRPAGVASLCCGMHSFPSCAASHLPAASSRHRNVLQVRPARGLQQSLGAHGAF